MDRVVGQLSLADGMALSERTIFDEIDGQLDWEPIRRLLGPRSRGRAGQHELSGGGAAALPAAGDVATGA